MVLSRVLFFLMLFSLIVYGQEQPPIQSFSVEEYLGGNQNWAISQGDTKYIYVANNDGLLEYNGADWNMYAAPNGSLMGSVKVIGNMVFAGYHMEMGFWEKDKFGKLVYTSLLDKLEEPLLDDETFWNIIGFDDWMVFQSLSRIYIYSIETETFKIIENPSKRALLFRVDDSLYYQKTGEGLFVIRNGEVQMVSSADILKNITVVGVYNSNGKLLVLTENGNFYHPINNELQQWETLWKPEKELSVYTSIRLNNGDFALGTISNGLYVVDKDGKLVWNINYENGLNNNTVLSLFQDKADNLWLGLDDGISILNLNSHFKEYVDKKGTLGLVYAAIATEDMFYIGTNQGLFYKPINQDAKFTMLKNTKGQVWSLKNINGDVFCGHNAGTFLIEGNTATLISDFPGTWDIKKVPNTDQLLLQGNHAGLSVLHRKNGTWELRNIIKGFNISSRFVEFLDARTIVVNNEFKGVYRLRIDDGFSAVIIEALEPQKGYGSSVFSYKSRVLYSNSSGVYEIDKDGRFNVDSTLTSIFYNGTEDITGPLTTDNNTGKILGFSDNNIVSAVPASLERGMRRVDISIPASFRRQLGNGGFEYITPMFNGNYFVGMSNGYVTLDSEEVEEKKFKISIAKVYQAFHNQKPKDVALVGNVDFESQQNNISFEYSVPEYDKYSSIYYQYVLEGKYDKWSNWSQLSEISFENLSYGDYVFKVRGKVGNVVTENEASYSFTIQRPWYLSHLALIAYVLGFVIISFLVHRLYKRYYKRQQRTLMDRNKKELKRKKLKAQKKLVQVNNEKLRTEIESKNRELAISTMSIIKKNEFLNAIKDQLKQVPESPELKNVIRTIDRNINNADDWKFFEEAFNNADKNFLRKVKNNHPELTPNDLKLCAYLRLNLSSKEIAPLLNISVRSVEVKRYRLRKKMNLPHEENLTDYIFKM